MQIRSDLAAEATELIGHDIDGVHQTTSFCGDMKITRITVDTKTAAEKIGKPQGIYTTCFFKALTDDFSSSDSRISSIAEEIKRLIPSNGTVLVAGIGNHNITPDSLGPKSCEKVLPTRHLSHSTAKALGLDDLRSVCVLSPGVLGQTGAEIGELLRAVAKELDICCIIAIDSLASNSLSRLGCTVQITDTGISPGAGIGLRRNAINLDTVGVPVIGIGVPTVADALTLSADILCNGDERETAAVLDKLMPDGHSMIVTPCDIDLLTDRASTLVGMSINAALQPDISVEDLFALI
ncbi:MAG: GPR endopeptidase [Acutalibacteraceae bacterium]|nr:GPR endopeptidase [Clostridia bacterium]MEE3450385.1 GPR endopeptidase [Acutalibacteraceae bacterium]